jgi:RNA polymerase sigma factor (sigma-70 family)
MSGVTTYVRGIAPRLAFLGLDVLVVQVRPSSTQSCLVRGHGRLRIASLGYRSADDVIASVDALLDGHALAVHCHEDLLLATAGQLSKRLRARLLHTVHFVHPTTVGLLRDQRAVPLAVSAAVVSELRSQGYGGELWLLRNFADPRWRLSGSLVRRGEMLRRSVGLSEERQVVLFAGRANARQKGADLLVQAVARIEDDVPDLTLAFAGTYWLPPETQTVAAALHGRTRVLGILGRGDLHAWYSAAAVVAVPSRYEPFGFSALEAQVVGTRVVAAGVGGLREVVHPQLGHLVDLPTGQDEIDTDDLAAALLSALRSPLSPAERSALSTWALTEFAVNGHLDTLRHLYGVASRVALSRGGDDASIQGNRTIGVMDHGDVAELDFDMTLDIAKRQATAFASTADEREQLATEAVARAWEARRRFDPAKGSLEQWLFGLVRNVARERRREQRRQRGLLARLRSLAGEVAAAPRGDVVDLRAAFSRLSEREQLVLYFRYWCDLPHAEVAGRLRLSESASRQIARRALIRLGRTLR